MSRFRVNCGGCGFNDILDDKDPPENEEAEDWDAERAAERMRDDRHLSEGHSVTIERVE